VGLSGCIVVVIFGLALPGEARAVFLVPGTGSLDYELGSYPLGGRSPV
jgi:hypothetical protein